VFDLEQFRICDQPGSFLMCALMRTKCAKKSCWYVCTIYDHREMTKVSTDGQVVNGVLQVVS
jgi:hypothetical protein